MNISARILQVYCTTKAGPFYRLTTEAIKGASFANRIPANTPGPKKRAN